MQCPDCGYQMTAFDKECPRCQRYTRSERSCPHCGTVNTADAAACKKCRHSFASSPSNALPSPSPILLAETPETLRPASDTEKPAEGAGKFGETTPLLKLAPAPLPDPQDAPLQSQAPPTPVPAAPPLSAEALACRMCGNTAGQKLTAICRAGSWSTQSRGYAVGMGYDGSGHSVMVGGPTASSSFGQTALASQLLPPRRPVFHASHIASILIPLIGFAVSLIAYSAGPVAATVGVLLTCGLWMLALLTEGRSAADGQARHDAACATWDSAMLVWNRLFYCSRCDHVYDPQAGTAAAPNAMHSLLRVQQTPVRPVFGAATDGAAVKAMSLAFGVGAVLLACLWSLSFSQQHEAQAQDAQITALRQPLETQFSAALPGVNTVITAADQASTRTVPDSNYTASEKQSQIALDLGLLKNHRDTAQQDLDTLSKPGDFAALQSTAGDARTEIDALPSSRAAVTADLQAFNQALVPAPSSPADTLPGSRYSITTQAGGGLPPDPSSLPH